MKKYPQISAQTVPQVASKVTKWVYQRFIIANKEYTQRLIFVLGCQRSGTTMLERCFEQDIRTKPYRHLDLVDVNTDPDNLVYPDAHGPRLKPYYEIEQIIAKEKAPLLIKKSLREGQHTTELLNYFPEARAIWMYRHYRDVTNSQLVKWSDGVGIRKLQPIFDGDVGNHWSSEKVSDSTREIVRKHFSKTMSSADAIALYWYTRNILFFELKLYKNPKVFLCKYEDIVTEPGQVMRKIYRFLDYSYPGDKIVKDIHKRSVNRGKSIDISKEIEGLCDNLLERMDAVNSSRSVLHYPKPHLNVSV